MPVISVAVDLAMAGLMVTLIAYCIKLNRRLSAIRDNDAEIGRMIEQLQAAADRADASVRLLKAAGMDAERSLRVQVARAEALRDELGAKVAHRPPPSHPPAADPYPDDDPYVQPAPRPSSASAATARRAAESELLKAIRSARAGGDLR